MTLPKQGNFSFTHSTQPDKPSMTASQLKAAFDAQGSELKTTLNAIVTALEQITSTSGAGQIGSETITDIVGVTIRDQLVDFRNKLKSIVDGSSGADFVNVTAIVGIAGSTVQAILEALKSYIDTHKTATTLDHPDLSVTSAKIADLSVLTIKLADLAITAAKLADNAVITQKINNLAVNTAKLADLAVTASKLADDSVITAKIADLNVTTSKIAIGALDSRYYTEAEIDTLLNTHINNHANPHVVTASQVGAYSKTEMQTTGQAQLHWNNVTNVPPMADAKWKAPVALVTDLPTTGNTDGDLRIVLGNDSVYTWDAPTSAWKIIGASGNGISDHGTLIGLGDDDHSQYLRTDGTRNLTGNQNFAQFQAQNLVEHKGTVFPTTPVVGQRFYRTDLDKSYLFKSTGWTDVSGRGAAIKDKEFTATAGQTVFDLTSVGQYEIGTNALTVFKNGNVLRESQYTETSTTSITLTVGANLNDVIYIKWFENSPEVINSSVKADGTLQTNLNADMVNGKHASDFMLTTVTGIDAAKIADGTVSNAEFQYLDGVTSAIQAQLNAKLPSASYTAADVLAKLITVDGAGSGLDADTVKGYVPVNKAGDTFARAVVTQPQLKDYSETLSTNATTTGAITLDIANGNVFDNTLTGATTFTFSNPAASGQACSFTLLLRQGATAQTVAWPASVVWNGGTAPDLTNINKTIVISFMTVNGGTRWYGFVAGNNFVT